MERRIYIAGPMRGKPLCNVLEFFRAVKWLKSNPLYLHGTKVVFTDNTIVNPMQDALESGLDLENGEDIPFIKIISGDLKQLDTCTDIVFLDGWEDSCGSTIEYLAAKSSGRIYMWEFMYSCMTGKIQDMVELPSIDVTINQV